MYSWKESQQTKFSAFRATPLTTLPRPTAESLEAPEGTDSAPQREAVFEVWGRPFSRKAGK
jgi:hypothetical protein